MTSSRLAVVLYLAGLALLPWSWFPPFPWLHERAQWSDAIFGAAALAWALDLWRKGGRVRVRPLHLALAAYLAAAALSLLLADPRPSSGPSKLLGMAELIALVVVTSELAARRGVPERMAQVTAGTMIVTGVAAVAGELLFLAGFSTPLIGGYGDLLPGAYARVQAGFGHPNLLASFCVFAWGVTERCPGSLRPPMRHAARAALVLCAGLAFSRGILALLLAVLVSSARTRRRRHGAMAFVLAAVSLMAALSVWNLVVDPTRPLSARLAAGSPSREQAFVSSLETLKARPWTGVGPGASPGRKDGVAFDAHFTPLNVAATLGLPALLALLAIPLLLWRERARPTDLVTWGALAGIGLDAMAQDVEDFRHLWILFGLADAGRRGAVVASAHP